MPPLLEVVQVTKRFGGVHALRGVSLAIEAGSLVALIGSNGAGKTTLFDIISGSERPTAGTVRFAGTDLTRLPPHRIARLGLGRTFQIARLFPQLRVLDNVLVGATFGHRSRAGRAARHRSAEHLLEVVGLHDKAAARAGELSLGEQKRVELAVALAIQPRLLLLDELTSGLPPRGREDVIRFYAELRRRGLTIFAIEHSFGELTQLADRVLVLDQGALVADGPPRVVLASPQVAEAYLGGEE
jgi:branched-chain amino acid transport system ATP-binding protein